MSYKRILTSHIIWNVSQYPPKAMFWGILPFTLNVMSKRLISQTEGSEPYMASQGCCFHAVIASAFSISGYFGHVIPLWREPMVIRTASDTFWKPMFHFNIKTVFLASGIPMIDMKWLWDHFILIIWIPLLPRQYIILNLSPRYHGNIGIAI